MNTSKILIKNFDLPVNADRLIQLLSGSEIKPLRCEIIMDKITGKSTGQAIMDFVSLSEAQEVIAGTYMLDGKKLGMEILRSL